MYTRRGDKGETSLYGPKRVRKDSARVEAYGTIDELNSYIGVVISGCKNSKIRVDLKKVQRMLFVAGADLATDQPVAKAVRITGDDTKIIEQMTDGLLQRLPVLKEFILPGGIRLSAELQFARAVCRRAERRVVALGRLEKVNPELVPFLNRLSSYLFNLARYTNQAAHVPEESWH